MTTMTDGPADETLHNREERRHIETLQRLLGEEGAPGPERAALAWAIKTLIEQETAVRVTRIESQIRKINGRMSGIERDLAEIIDQDHEDDR